MCVGVVVEVYDLWAVGCHGQIYHCTLQYYNIQYISHRASIASFTPNSLPACYAAEGAEGEEECTSLVVTMCDSFTKLELDLIYTVYRDFDVVCRRAVVRNASKTARCVVKKVRRKRWYKLYR